MSNAPSQARAFQYSILVHLVFVVILVLSWGHVPKPEQVQVSLWSSAEMANDSAQPQPSQHVQIPEAVASVPPQVAQQPPVKPLPKISHVEPKPQIRERPVVRHIPSHTHQPKVAQKAEPDTTLNRLTHNIRELWNSKADDEEAAIQVERKHHSKRMAKHEEAEHETKNETQHELKHKKQRYREVPEKVEPTVKKVERKKPEPPVVEKNIEKKYVEKKLKLEPRPVHSKVKEIKETAKAELHRDKTVTKAPVKKVAGKPLKERSTADQRDDKAEAIEDQMNIAGTTSHHLENTKAEGQAGSGKAAARSGGHKGSVDCSKLGEYCSRIIRKIKGNMEWSEEGTPEDFPVFEVKLFPNGEVQSVQRKKSSGNPAYDIAVEQAIRASSPLPRPEDSTALSDNRLVINYHPR